MLPNHLHKLFHRLNLASHRSNTPSVQESTRPVRRLVLPKPLKIFLHQIGTNHSQVVSQQFRVLHCANERKLVLRSLFVDKNSYIAHIKENKLDDKYLKLLDTHLSDRFWMVELSCRELFSATRAKFGEILLDVSDVDAWFDGKYIPLGRVCTTLDLFF